MSDNCSNCFYRGSMNGGALHYCKYIFLVESPRPCPPGEGCTVKVPRKVARRKRKDGSK